MGCCGSNEQLPQASSMSIPDEEENKEDERKSKERGQEKTANRAIRSGLKDAQQQDAKMKKLLLLGTGSSGKSTIFKQLKVVHQQEPFEENDFIESRPIIRRNLVQTIMILLQKSQYLADREPEKYQELRISFDETGLESKSPEEQRHIMQLRLVFMYSHFAWESMEAKVEEKQLTEEEDAKIPVEYDLAEEKIKEYLEASAQGPVVPDIDDNMLRALGEAVFQVWRNPAIQKTYDLRGIEKFSLIENMDYFFERTQIIFRPSYFPNQEDLLKVRMRTTGIVQETYEADKKPGTFLHIFDVGGQRGERKKWINIFDNVTAVIFVAALNHYCAVLFEDERINAMRESLRLFDEIINSKWFKNTEMILFLNKNDLFIERLREGHPLSICFNNEDPDDIGGWTGEPYSGVNYLDPMESRPKFYEGPEDPTKRDSPIIQHPLNEGDDVAWFDYVYMMNLSFIQERYLELNKLPKRHVFGHVTTATNPDNIQQVFWDVQNIVIRSNLKRSGLV